jgi:hypothetical protein
VSGRATGVRPEQRATKANPCPACGGHKDMPQGQDVRCWGYVSSDGEYAHCTREAYAGGLPRHEESDTYAHKLTGDCKCGVRHDASPAPERNGRARQRNGKKAASRPPTTWEIKDHTGKLKAYHVRWDYADGDKKYSWKRPDGHWGLNGTPVADMPLYGSEGVDSLPKGRSIVVVEGEKAADALNAVGMCAVGTVTGAGSTPNKGVLEVLRDRKVCLWPDNDDKGIGHMRRVASHLEDVAASVRWFEWKDAPDKGDAADYPAIKVGSPSGIMELGRLLKDAPEWAAASDEGGREAGGHAPAIETVSASEVVTERVRWLWEKRIPFGKLTIFDGDPDMGKSVVTTDIAARVSTGRGFPDGAECEAANVAIVNVEDGVADTIVPRLKAAGADLDRCQIVKGLPDGKGGTRLIEIPQDIAALESFVQAHDIKLLIVDPVLTMLGGDANKDQDARKALAPLRDMAERTGCAVVAVRHLNKSVGLKAIQRGGGNMGLIGVARAGCFFAQDPEDDRRRIMAPHKSNLAEKPPSLVYCVVTSEVHDTARLEWMGVSEYDANALAADGSTPHEKSELDEAREFLRDELSDGAMWAKQVFKDARDAGISEKTLRRAKAAISVRSEKIGVEGWQWSMPPKAAEEGHANPVGHVGHVGHVRNGHPENSPYLSEGGQHSQGGQHGQGAQGGDEGGHVRNGGRGRRLTEDEAREVQRLISEGMMPRFARAEVLGEEA